MRLDHNRRQTGYEIGRIVLKIKRYYSFVEWLNE